MRFEMFRTMRYIERYLIDHPDRPVITGDALRAIYSTRSRQRALHALAARNCVNLHFSDDELRAITISREGWLYLLDRTDLWFDRIVTFFAGVSAPLLVQFILRLFS